MSYCPCYIDSICFISVVVGELSGWYFLAKVSRNYGLELKDVSNFLQLLKRSTIGLATIVAWKSFWGFIRRRFKDLDIIIRIVTYSGIGFLATLVLPLLLSMV